MGVNRGIKDAVLPANDVLRDILATGEVIARDGKRRPVYANISAMHAAALYGAVLRQRPSLVVEIGMCFGIASLAILSALEEIGEGGRLVSIDPAQTSNEDGMGLLNVERAGLASHHAIIEEPSYAALPVLLRKGERIDFAYVDGWHTFDYVLLDFFYLDKMLDAGGIIGFNDCGFRAIARVLRFIRGHRSYEEVNVGLEEDFRGRHPGITLLRRLLGWSRADRYFRKTRVWEPDGYFYARF